MYSIEYYMQLLCHYILLYNCIRTGSKYTNKESGFYRTFNNYVPRRSSCPANCANLDPTSSGWRNIIVKLATSVRGSPFLLHFQSTIAFTLYWRKQTSYVLPSYYSNMHVLKWPLIRWTEKQYTPYFLPAHQRWHLKYLDHRVWPLRNEMCDNKIQLKCMIVLVTINVLAS